MKLKWRRGTPAPREMGGATLGGAAVVHGDITYFSAGYNVYSYTPSQDKWTALAQCEYKYFSMAVADNLLTIIGGMQRHFKISDALHCLVSTSSTGKKWKKSSPRFTWEKCFPPMPTARELPAAVTTPTHLIVAGGKTGLVGVALAVVETLDLHTLQWSSVSSSPKPLENPSMTLCNGRLYLSKCRSNTIFSCSVEELLKSNKYTSTWTNFHVPYHTSLITQKDYILAISGNNPLWSNTPTKAIHRYNRSNNSWSNIEEIPTPRVCPLVAVLPSHELIVVGGYDCTVTEIAS